MIKLQIIYVIESIYDVPLINHQERIFVCEVRSMYEWRNLLAQAVNLRFYQEIFVLEIKEIR
jgi:hypothetical protein